jgi:hypothetical protein
MRRRKRACVRVEGGGGEEEKRVDKIASIHLNFENIQGIVKKLHLSPCNAANKMPNESEDIK